MLSGINVGLSILGVLTDSEVAPIYHRDIKLEYKDVIGHPVKVAVTLHMNM